MRMKVFYRLLQSSQHLDFTKRDSREQNNTHSEIENATDSRGSVDCEQVASLYRSASICRTTRLIFFCVIEESVTQVTNQSKSTFSRRNGA